MILKYLQQSVYILLWVLLLSSCLNSETRDFDLSKDAQIYSINMSSRPDSNRYLSDTKFSIDQVNGRIFNRDSLPYLFDVDSVDINISGKANQGFSSIIINLTDNDSSYIWNGTDSIAFKRIRSIETTALDGKSVLRYELSINIHQQDPYIFTWDQLAAGQLPSAIEQQKTVSYKGNFYSYFISGDELKASFSPADNGSDWTSVVIAGLPDDVILSSIVSVDHPSDPVLYMNSEGGDLYRSLDGVLWEKVDIDYPVISVFGVLPSFSGDFAILFAAEADGEIKYATTEDFTSVSLWNNLNSELPVKNFSAVNIENPTVFAAKYIILFGGETINGVENDKIWIIQEKGGQITAISKMPDIDVISAELFIYDKRVYLLVYDGVENLLYYSNNYGLDWIKGDESQKVAEDFTLRKNSSVLTDEDNFIWIFGGESVSNTLIIDVWRGRLNKLAK